VKAIAHAHDDRSRMSYLPWRKSKLIEDKLREIVKSKEEGRKSKMRYCYYLSALLLLYNLAPQIPKMTREELPDRLEDMSLVLKNGIIGRFTQPNGKSMALTDKGRTKLLAWICVLFLLLGNWSVDMAKVAEELRLSITKVSDMYKSLGCTVEVMRTEMRQKLGLSLAEAQRNKRAILKAPVVFPRIKRRAPAQR